MASKLIGVLQSLSQQITVERTDVPSGPHTVTLADGEYFPLDRGIGVASAGATSVTVTFAAAHSFVVGDVLTCWGVVADTETFEDTVTDVPAANQVTFGGAHTWLINDHFFVSEDLVGYLVTRVRSQDYVNMAGFEASLTQQVWSFAASGGIGVAFTITWPTTTLRDWLRYTGTVSVLLSVETPNPTRQVVGSCYIDKNIQSDSLILPPRASQAEGVTGILETLYRAQVRRRNISMRTTGPPRSSVATTYQALEDMWSTHLARGLRWRYYVDASNEAPYVVIDNPLGYDVMVHLGPAEWRWNPIQQGNDNHGDASILAQEYVVE